MRFIFFCLCVATWQKKKVTLENIWTTLELASPTCKSRYNEIARILEISSDLFLYHSYFLPIFIY